jgi:hypothetical protein
VAVWLLRVADNNKITKTMKAKTKDKLAWIFIYSWLILLAIVLVLGEDYNNYVEQLLDQAIEMCNELEIEIN